MKVNKWVVFGLGFALMLCAGLVFSWSIFVEPIEAELGLSRDVTSLVFPISLSVSIGGQIIAGLVGKKYSFRINFLVAAVLFLGGFFIASNIQTIGGLYLSYGVLVGLAIGMLYNSVLASVVLNFGAKGSMITGFLLMGFGLGSMALGTVAAAIIEASGWRVTFRIFAVVFSLLSLAGAVIISRPANVQEIKSQDSGEVQVPPKEMVRRPSYILTFLWCTVVTGSCLVILGHAALCVADIGANAYVAAMANGLVAITNVVSRGVLAPVQRKLNPSRMQMFLSGLGLASSAVCLAGYVSGSLAVILVGYAMLGFLNGGCTIAINSNIMDEYGKEYFGINMAITNIHLAIASMLGPAVAGFIRTRFDSYTLAFVVMLALNGLGMLFWAMNRKNLGAMVQKTKTA